LAGAQLIAACGDSEPESSTPAGEGGQDTGTAGGGGSATGGDGGTGGSAGGGGSTQATLVAPYELVPWMGRTSDVGEDSRLDIANWFTGYHLYSAKNFEQTAAWHDWSPNDQLLWAYANGGGLPTFPRDNVEDAMFRGAAGYPASVPQVVETEPFTGNHGVYLEGASENAGAKYRSTIGNVSGGAPLSGEPPRMLTHGKQYFTTWAYKEMNAAGPGDTGGPDWELIFQFHNNNPPPSAWSSPSWDWYINDQLSSTTFTDATVQSNPQLALYRTGDHYFLRYRTVSRGVRREYTPDQYLVDGTSLPGLPVRVGQWVRIGIDVQFHNDVAYPVDGDAPPGGWTGHIRLYYARGDEPFSDTPAFEVTSIRLGWLYDAPDQGPTTHWCLYGAPYDGANLRTAYADMLMQSGPDTGMTIQEMDPLRYRWGEPMNSPMQFSITDAPPGVTLSADGVFTIQPTTAGSYAPTLTVTNAAGAFTKTVEWTID
jgi:hypothetical protein